jgi:hypothetical protein
VEDWNNEDGFCNLEGEKDIKSDGNGRRRFVDISWK